MANKEHLINVNNLVVRYGNKIALDNLNLDVGCDEGVIGLFGQNGAGKTTFFKTLIGDIQIYDGLLTKPNREDIAFLPDKPFLYDWMTVDESISLYKSRHLDFRPEIAREFLQGSKIANKSKISSLSKGMSERLHLAITIARKPKLYILDEPLAGVDPYTREELLAMITKYRHQEAPLILSTHLISGVESIFDNIMIINDGSVLLKKEKAYFDSENKNLEEIFKEIIRNV